MPEPGRAQASVLLIGCGFIGSHVAAELARRGRPPAILTRSRPPAALLGADDSALIGDASDPALLERALDGVDEVVYAAGGLLPAASEREPERDAELTLRPLRAVLAALSARPGVGLTYISSGGTVYGQPDRLPVPEDAPTNPIGAYGRLHLVCEEEIERERAERGLRARILRCATVYGENQLPDRGQGAVVTFLGRIERGEAIDLYGDGETVRDYVYAGDVAAVVADLIGSGQAPGILNVGSGVGTSLTELLRLAESQVGREAIVARHPERSFDVHRIVLDTTRLRDLTGFEPTPLEAGVERTHRWLRTALTERA